MVPSVSLILDPPVRRVPPDYDQPEWQAYLAGTHPSIKFGQRTFRHIPSSPRCKLCSVPFAGMGPAALRLVRVRLGTMEFTRLMQRFYVAVTSALIADEAISEKFVGDEVVGFFMPLMTGPNHAAAAVRAAEHLLLETGHGEEGGPGCRSAPECTRAAAGLAVDGLERRHLSLKGHETNVIVLQVPSASSRSVSSP